MSTDREKLMAKAQARLAAMKATTADAPVVVPGSYPPKLETPAIVYQDTKGNPIGVLKMISEIKFWCATPGQIVHMPSGKELKFVNHGFKSANTTEIALLRSLSRNYPSKFKEI